MDKKKQLIAVCVAIIGVVGIYFGTTIDKPKKDPSVAAAHDHDHDDHDGHDHGPAQGGGPMMGAAMVPPANFDSLVTAVKKKLSPQKIERLLAIENMVVRGDVKEQDIKKNQELGALWEEYKQPAIAAHFYGQSGILENSEKKLNFATHLFQEVFSKEENPAMKQWIANEAIDLMTKSLEINPNNDSVEMNLYVMMIDKGDVMNGVLKLRAFAESHPDNIAAHVILGKMSLQSNQLDKAIERGKTVLKLDKNNLEAYLFMGEAYKQKGEVEKAIELFEEAKKVLNDPNFSKDVDAYIATFKKTN